MKNITKQSWLRHKGLNMSLPITLIFIFGTATSFFLFFSARELEHRKAKTQFLKVASDRISILKDKISSQSEELYSIRDFFMGSEKVEYEEFLVFTKSYIARNPDVRNIFWIPHVISEEREQFEAEAMYYLYTNKFEITETTEQGSFQEAGYREHYYPLYYIAPKSEGIAQPGVDIGSIPAIKGAIDLASSTDSVTSVSLADLPRLSAEPLDFILILPVLRNKKEQTSDRPNANDVSKIDGYVAIYYMFAETIKTIENYLSPAEIGYTIYRDRDQTEMHYSRAAKDAEPRKTFPLSKALRIKKELSESVTIQLGHKDLNINIYAYPEYLDDFYSWVPYGIFSAGIALTGLLGSYVIRAVHQARITELIVKKRTSELKKSEERYKTLSENIDIGITLINRDYEILYTNSAIGKMFNRPVGEFLGKKCYEEFEKRKMICPHCPGTAAIDTHQKSEVVTEGIRDDGCRFCAKIKAFPIFESEKEPTGFIEVVEDITEQKESEIKLAKAQAILRASIEQNPAGVIIAEPPDVKIKLVNSAALGIRGRTDIPLEDISAGNHPINWQTYHTNGQPYCPEDLPLSRAILKGETIKNKIVCIKHDTGKTRWVLANAAPVRDAENNIIAGVVVFADITDLRKAQQEREKLMRELKAKNDELESIIYASSHDLRAPLVNIQGFGKELELTSKYLAEKLKEVESELSAHAELQEIIRSEIPESIGYIVASAEKMDSLQQGLLQLSRLGKVELNPETLDMNQIFKNITDSLMYQINLTKTRVIVDDLPKCTGDRSHINRVFSNLIDNALKYRKEGRESRIFITGQIQGDKVVYCVEDNGVGISLEDQQKVFEIFHRLDPSGEVKGEGIGLTIVKRIINKHHGDVWVESEPGEGSKFYVSLPKSLQL